MKRRYSRKDDCYAEWYTFTSSLIQYLPVPCAILSEHGDILDKNRQFGRIADAMPRAVESLTFQLKHAKVPRGPGGSLRLPMPEGALQDSCVAIPFYYPEREARGWLVILSVSSLSHAWESIPCEERLRALVTSCGEVEESLRRLAGGDRSKIVPLDPSDPLFRLKFRYNDAIDAIDRIISVKGLFGD